MDIEELVTWQAFAELNYGLLHPEYMAAQIAAYICAQWSKKAKGIDEFVPKIQTMDEKLMAAYGKLKARKNK